MSNLRDWSGNVKPKRFCVLRSCFGGGRNILVCLIASGIPAALDRTLHPRNRPRTIVTLHSTITFAAESGRKLRWPTYFTFVASRTAGWLANTAVLLVAVEVLLLPVWLAKLAAIMASFIVNFSLSNFVVLRVRRSLPATT